MSSTLTGFGFGVSGLANLGLNSIEPMIFGPTDVVVLGGVVLVDFEMPEQINFGGTQRIVSHLLPGGERIFDMMGREEEAITWSGIFLGAGSIGRATQFDVLRAQGNVLLLTWGTLSYQVVIESFSADYKKSQHIPYKISCKVLRDNSAPAPDNTVKPDQSVSNDVSDASDSMPKDASPHVVTKTKVETNAAGTPGTSVDTTYAPLKDNQLPFQGVGVNGPTQPNTDPFQGLGTESNAAQAAGNNINNSALSVQNAGPPFSIPGGTDSVTAMHNAQTAADAQTIEGLRAITPGPF